MRSYIYKFVATMLCVVVTGIGISLALKAAIGVGAWEALSQTLANLITIKVGTVAIILNISCVLLQLLILKKDFKIFNLLQIAVAFILGSVVNFMLYNVYSDFVITSYIVSVALVVIGISICAVGVSMAMAINFISFPLEALCMVVGEKVNRSFGSIRQLVDIISIILVFVLSFVFKESITVREGTIIAMLIFGPLLDLFTKLFVPKVKLMGLAY